MKTSKKSARASLRLQRAGQQPWRQICRASIAAVSAIAVPAVTFAGLYFWTGAKNGNWNNTVGGTNWSSSADAAHDPGTIPGSADDVNFVLFGAGNLNTTLGQNFSIHSLTFTPDAQSPVTIGGSNTLTIGAGGLTDNSNSSMTLSTNVAVGANQTWQNNSSSQAVTVSGIISGTSSLTLAGTSSVTVPSGAFTFTNAESFSGALTLLNDHTTLVLSGNGSLGNVTNLTLGGGTTLTLDDTVTPLARLGSGVGVKSNGGAINLIGNAATATSESIGTLTLSTGTTAINVVGSNTGGAVPTTLTIGGLSRSVGGAVAFNPTLGATIAAPSLTNTAGTILAGYAVYGPVSGATYVPNDTSTLNWATVSGGKIAPVTTYGNTLAAGVDAQIVNSTVQLTTGTSHVNSLYFAGSGSAANTASIDPVANTNVLIVDSGGIIASGGTDTYSFNGQSYVIVNALSLGSNNFNGNSGGGFGPEGSITSGTTDLSVFTANGSSMRLGMALINNGSNAVGLTKNGNGILDLSQGNNQTKTSDGYSGITTINGGILFINNETQLGVDPASFVANQLTFNGGELRSSASITLVANRGITVGPQGGTITYAGGNTFTAGSVITGPGGIAFGAISGGTSNADAMAIALVNATYQGPTTVESSNQCYVILNVNNPFPTATALTVTHGTAPGNSTLAGSTQANIFLLNGHNLTVGSLAGEGNLSNSGGTAVTLTVGANNVSTSYTGVLGGAPVGGGNQTATTNFNLVKIGTGNLTLTSAGLYANGTIINGGAIVVTNSSGSGTGSGAVTINSGGALGGSGIVTGPVTVNQFGALSPSVAGATATTLQLNGGVALNSGAVLDINLAVPNPIRTTVNLTPTSDDIFTSFTSFAAGTDTINITNTGIPASVAGGTPATYQLITAASQPNLNGVNFTVNGPLTFVYSVVSDAVNNSVDLIVSKNPNPSLVWVGNPGSGNWDTTSTVWEFAGGGVATFTNGANVTFDNTPGTSGAVVTTNSSVSPGSVTFANNVLLPYTFNGAGGIAGNASFAFQSTGTVTFNNVNTATGSANIAGGNVIVGAGGALANNAFTIASGTSLTVNGSLTGTAPVIVNSGTFTLNSGGSVSPATSLNLLGSGTATLNENATLSGLSGPATTVTTVAGTKTLTLASGTSSYDGLITGGANLKVTSGNFTISNGNNVIGSTSVTGGSLLVTNTTGSATGTGAVHVFSGGTLGGSGIVTGAITVDSGGTLAGTGTFSPTGVIQMAGAVSPGGAGVVGALNTGGMTMSSGSSFNYDFGTPGGGSDFLNVGGVLTLSGTDTVNIDPIVGFTAGTYTLATATSISGTATFNPVVNSAGAGFNSIFQYSIAVVGKSIVLTTSFPTITWTGSSSSNWNFTDLNWSTGNQQYTNTGFAASFNDQGANANVVLDQNVAPQGGLVFNNNAVTYNFSADANAPNGVGGTQGIIMNGTGVVNLGASLTNTFTGGTTINSGTVNLAADYSLGAVPAAVAPAAITINDGGTLGTIAGAPSFTLSANRGMALGSTGGVGATISVGSGTVLTYSGIVANVTGQNGVLNKAGSGELDLGGANTFSGGFNVNGGSARLLTATAAGTGAVSVNNGVLDVGAGITNNVNLNNGSTIGNNGVGLTLTGNVTISGNATLDTYSAVSGTTNADFILTGLLQGSGNLTVQNQQAGATPDGTGLRVRTAVSTGANQFSGTVTLLPSTKFEVQTNGQTTGSQLGTATIVMDAGTFTGGNGGTFSLMNLRNNSSAAVTLGNNVRVVGGAGNFALINLVAPSAGAVNNGTPINMGTLTIGDAGLGVGATTGVTPQALTFTSVALTGSNADFDPTPSEENTYVVAEILSLGPISDSGSSNPNGSGITMGGLGTLNLTATNSYRGSTTVNAGTLVPKVAGAIPANSPVVVNGGALDLNNGAVNADLTVVSLSGNGGGGSVTNSDTTNLHTFTVNQASGVQTYAGSINGNLNFVKTGAGTLQLTGGTHGYTGTTMVSGGNLSIGGDAVNGAIFGGAFASSGFTVTNGATLSGSGTVTGVTMTNGTLAPGNPGGAFNGAGLITMNTNGLVLGANNTLSLTLAGTTNTPGTAQEYSQISVVAGSLVLNGNLQLTINLGSGYQPAQGDTFFIVENGTGSEVGSEFANAQVPGGNIEGSIATYTDAAGDVFKVSYTANESMDAFAPGSGQDIAVQIFSAVPEPGSFATVLSGMGLLLGLQRFRRRS